MSDQVLLRKLKKFYGDDKRGVTTALIKIRTITMEDAEELYDNFHETHEHDAASATATPEGDSTQIIAYPNDYTSSLTIPWDFGQNTQNQHSGGITIPPSPDDTGDVKSLREQTLMDDGSQEPQFAQYIYTGNEPGHADICARFDKKIFNLDDDIHRPVPPSEGKGFTNTHPNCQCYWRMISGAKYDWTPDIMSENDQTSITNIHKKIGQRAKSGKLHTVKPDGSLSKRTRGTNPRNVAYTVMREALLSVRQEFKWLTQKYEDAVRQLPVDGKWFVIRASTSTITDHRSEGEPYRRMLSPNELHALTRTAIGKEMDVNHNPDWKTQAVIYDAEYDVATEQSQMLVLERDPDIIQAIENKIITAVSINGGSPRSEKIECTDEECFVVPEGVVLGELDNVALTWVVTDPRGFFYKGEMIQPAMPGVKNTIIESF